VAAMYDALLRGAPGWISPAPGAEDPGRLLTCYVVRVASEALRAGILKDLADEGIAARPPMISLLDVPHVVRAAATSRGFPGTELAARTAFGLPLLSDADGRECERVVAAVLRSGARRWAS
jgi:dTDP-4-amino-4,6-dideoxygalactose transaminase